MKRRLRGIGLVMAMVIVLSSLIGSGVNVVQAADYTSAPTLDFSATWSGEKFISETNSEHWYKVVIPSDGKFHLKIMSYTYSMWSTVFNSDLSATVHNDRIWDGSETQPSTETYDIILSQGTYYLKINGDYGKYKMYSEFTSYGVNDTNAISYDMSQAYSISNQITGAITKTDGEDWFKFNISRDGTYHLEVTSYTYSMWSTVFNSDLSATIHNDRVWDGSETQPSIEKYNIVLSQGTYYLKMNGDVGKYIFKLSELTPDMCEHDYDDVSTTYATYFKKGSTVYRCATCGDSYSTYSAKLKLGQTSLSTYSSYSGKKYIYAYWYTVSDATGYKLRYSTKRSMKGAKTKTIKGEYSYAKTLRGLKRRKRYYLQVRPYVKSGSKIAYGKWSSKLTLKTK